MTAPATALSEAHDPTKLRLRFWLHLLKASRHVENALRERLRREFDTTLPRFDVMAVLEKSGAGLKMSQLSAHLMVSNGNVTGIIDRLVADGQVARVPIKGDRRATLVRLTAKGAADFATMAEIHEDWVNTLFEGLSDDEITHAMTLFSRIRGV